MSTIIYGTETQWVRGRSAVVRVNLTTFNHSVIVDGKEWLVSLPPQLHCNGEWSVLAPVGNHATIQTGQIHPTLGTFDAVSFRYDIIALSTLSTGTHSSYRGKTLQQVFTTTIKYFTTHDAFLFEQQFPTQGCTNTAVDQTRDGGPAPFEFNAATLPLSMFPRWSYTEDTLLRSVDMGYVTWTGRFMHDHSSHGTGLGGYHGGQEGGPLLLFNATEPTAFSSDHPLRSALVMSQADNFMDAIHGICTRLVSFSLTMCY